ncbi:MAG: hypothetical protein J5995_05835 [Muribaculaceae bacterium]|nr:hypothetical protein [Muribaculaceae bacterium]
MKGKALIAICALLLLAAGCKPTEKGYKAAYDAAKAKREYVDPELELLTGGHRLLDDGASNWKVIGSDSLQVQTIRISPGKGEQWPQSGPYRLAVAMFKMDTNAGSLLSDLQAKGCVNARVAADGKGKHYIIAGSATSADSLGAVLSDFRQRNPDFPYIGMTPPAPIIIISR